MLFLAGAAPEIRIMFKVCNSAMLVKFGLSPLADILSL